MTDPSRRKVCLSGLAALVVWTLIPVPVARSQSPLSEGLDLVILVDVSRSMYTQDRGPNPLEHQPNGSDPLRIRWDAVGLILNLLTAEDRVMIVPLQR